MHEINQEDEIEPDAPVNVQLNEAPLRMTLPGFVRTPITGRTCIFFRCINISRHRIPKKITKYYLLGIEY